jgi:hypothetical protein
MQLLTPQLNFSKKANHSTLMFIRVEWFAFFEKFNCGLKSCICLLRPSFVLHHYKILRSSTRASALKIEHFHSRVKMLGWPTKWYGTFSGRKLFADSKNVHGLYPWRSILTTRSKKVKNSWNFQIFSIRFLWWPVAVRTDLHRYKISSFLESGCNL